MSSELKEIINQSILNYLHINGFPKTLKRFQSEAQIQNDTWKDSSVKLVDIYSNYINSSCENEDKVVVEPKTKNKKKSKHETEEAKSDAPKKVVDDAVTADEVEVKESKKKTKDKKKKSNQQDQKEVCVKENGDADLDVVKEEKKSSKKRKRLLSDENENENHSDKKHTNETVVEEAAKDNEVDGSDEIGREKNGGEKSESQKSGKKQRIGSAEPKTVNAFQRVKIDQVEFAHEKLQDNSYWAKDGADVGYGAKAQEVLGQVRGRDFRHEKTKKKRGSYRGGQIDLQSHSIKFDYSDEE